MKHVVFCFLVIYCLVTVTAKINHIIPENAADLSFEDVLEGANPSIIFIIPPHCTDCLSHTKLMEYFSIDGLYAGDVFLLNSSDILWQIPVKPPAILLADSSRKLPYIGPVHHVHLQNAIHQFSSGVRAARLDDANFEHDTQASTGSTTGSWMIIFDSINPETMALYDGLCLSLRARSISLGIVDPKVSISTAKRFDALSGSMGLTLIMLHRSELYRFDGIVHRSDTDQLLDFGLNTFHKHRKSVIPRPRKFFDELLDWLVKKFVELEGRYGSQSSFLGGLSILLIAMTTISLIVASCFWFVRQSERETAVVTIAELSSSESEAADPTDQN